MTRTALAAAAALVGFAAQPIPAADVLYVKAARLILDVTRPPVSPGAVVITDGIVTSAGSNLRVPDGARQIDAGPLTIMPSLIDAHTHLAGGSPGAQPADRCRSDRPPTPRSARRKASSVH